MSSLAVQETMPTSFLADKVYQPASTFLAGWIKRQTYPVASWCILRWNKIISVSFVTYWRILVKSFKKTTETWHLYSLPLPSSLLPLLPLNICVCMWVCVCIYVEKDLLSDQSPWNSALEDLKDCWTIWPNSLVSNKFAYCVQSVIVVILYTWFLSSYNVPPVGLYSWSLVIHKSSTCSWGFSRGFFP